MPGGALACAQARVQARLIPGRLEQLPLQHVNLPGPIPAGCTGGALAVMAPCRQRIWDCNCMQASCCVCVISSQACSGAACKCLITKGGAQAQERGSGQPSPGLGLSGCPSHLSQPQPRLSVLPFQHQHGAIQPCSLHSLLPVLQRRRACSMQGRGPHRGRQAGAGRVRGALGPGAAVAAAASCWHTTSNLRWKARAGSAGDQATQPLPAQRQRNCLLPGR